MSRINARNGGFLTEKVTIRLNEERFNQLEAISNREGFPVPVIVRHLIHRFLDQEKRGQVTRG